MTVAKYKQLQVQYARLWRNYRLAEKLRDLPTSLDLTHTLRVWTELKHDVDLVARARNVLLAFPPSPQHNALKNALKGRQFAHMPFAGGMGQSGPVKILSMVYMHSMLTEEDFQRLHKAGSPAQPGDTTQSFINWMGGSIVQMPSIGPGHRHIQISREILISRTSNILGASHPIGMDESNAREHGFDPYVRALHSLIISNMPGTYFQMTEIARHLLDSLRILVGAPEDPGWPDQKDEVDG